MNNMLTGTNGTHFSSGVLRTTAVFLLGLAFSLAIWTASTPDSLAQNMSPVQMIEANLPEGKTISTANKNELLAAVCAAIKKNRGSAAQIVRAAVEARKQWTRDIVRAAFECTGSDDCRLLGRILRGAIAGNPDDASALTEYATDLVPSCAGSFGGTDSGDDDGGNFGNVPGNQNPPPGSIGGGGGQSNVVAVCINGVTRFFTPEGAEDALRNNPGATLGACQVTPVQNQ